MSRPSSGGLRGAGRQPWCALPRGQAPGWLLFRSRKKNGREVSLYEPIGTDKEGNEISLLDILESSDGDIAEAMDFRKNLRRLYKIFDGTLTEREKRVLILRYGMFGGEEKTQREIAEKLHISRSYVSRTMAR